MYWQYVSTCVFGGDVQYEYVFISVSTCVFGGDVQYEYVFIAVSTCVFGKDVSLMKLSPYKIVIHQVALVSWVQFLLQNQATYWDLDTNVLVISTETVNGISSLFFKFAFSWLR